MNRNDPHSDYRGVEHKMSFGPDRCDVGRSINGGSAFR